MLMECVRQILRSRLSIGLFLIAAILLPNTSLAQPSVGDILEWLDDQGSDIAAKTYIAAIEHGLSWANAHNADNGLPMLYCLPPNLGLTGDQTVSIFVRYAEDNSVAEYPVGLVLMEALKEVFPC